MTEPDNNNLILAKLSKQLSDSLTELLSVGDWESSLFLRATAHKLSTLHEKIKQLNGVTEPSSLNQVKKTQSEGLSTNELPVFVLLYQANNKNLANWYSGIKMLTEYGMTRPVYKQEQDVQELIRTKADEIEKYGYVKVNIDPDDVIQDATSTDRIGHPLLTLKEGAFQLANMVEFIHANQKRYKITDQQLEFLEDI